MRRTPTFVLSLLIIISVFFFSCDTETPINYPEGGYDYPKKVEDSNYYFYPLRDIFSKRDSFYHAFVYVSFKAFDEPNLSLRAGKEDVFRLSYYGHDNIPLIITLTKNKIVIKKGSSEITQKEDTNRLTKIENLHYRILNYDFPIKENDFTHNPSGKKTDDSLVKLYPQLLEAAYFKYLILKTFVVGKERYKYNIEEHSISTKEFRRLVSIINDSGYWKLPCRIACPEVMDSDYYTLEASIKNKYNVVTSDSCPDNASGFSAICQEIIKAAGLDKEINLILKTHISNQ